MPNAKKKTTAKKRTPGGSKAPARKANAKQTSAKKTSAKQSAKQSAKRAPAKRKNLDHRDADHQVEVTRHWRLGEGKLSARQRAVRAGQQDFFGESPHTRHALVRNNPNSQIAPGAVADVYEMFQGRAPESAEQTSAATGTPAKLAQLGALASLTLKRGDVIKFADDRARLASDANGNLHITGGALEIDFEPIDTVKGLRVVDEVKKISYITNKDHIGDGREFEFVHRFGEEGGSLPFLALDAENFPHLLGGSYDITAAGIRD
jgi:hypothetical protein